VPLGRRIALQVVARNFNVAGSRPGEVKLVYDRERTTASDGRRAQCVIAVKSKERKEENPTSCFVLLIIETRSSEAGAKVYRRAVVGVMLERFIALNGEGVKGRIM
jgi:hypothetical protein